MREILINPNERLRKKSRPITAHNLKQGKYDELSKEMIKIMLAKDGIGLAAPQINEQVRLIIVNTKEGIMVFCNPEIVSRSWKKESEEEGCLSVPGVTGLVKRNYKIEVTAKKLSGEVFMLTAKGLFARVIQHEVDHLDGILFIDKAKKIFRKNNERKD